MDKEANNSGRKTERSKLDRAELADAILSSALDCIIVSDADGHIIEFNQAAERTFGMTRADVIGLTMEQTIIPPHHRDAHRNGMQRFLATGKARVLGKRVELEALHSDGHIFPVELTLSEASLSDARVFVATLRDVTSQRSALNQLEEVRATLSAIFDNVPAAIYLRDRQDRLVMINSWGAGFLGRDAAEMIGQPMSKFREPQNVARVAAVDANIVKTGKPETHEFTYHLKGGDKTGLMTFFPVSDGRGEVTHIGGMLLDVTEFHRARMELQEARATLAAIFDNIPAALYLRELDGTIIIMNQYGADLFGKTPEQMTGESIANFDRGDEIEIAKKSQVELLTTRKSVTQEYHFTLPARESIILNTIFPVKDESGNIIRIGGISSDVTELYKARSELQRAQENLHQSEKLAALGQLLAGVAHELNNPLAVVLGRAAILQEKLKDTPHSPSLLKLREAADRCARIVKTFLAMARQTGPRRQQADVHELVETALEMTSYGLRNANIVWSKEFSANVPKIEVDEDQIIQVLINLILNAQHALESQPENRRIKIRTELRAGGNWLHITVADNGTGVHESIASRIFDPFFTTKSVGKGTGLGLSVCKGMVEAHGGKLVLQNTPGGGATFLLTLPVQMTDALTKNEQKVDNAEPYSRGRVLIVDDEVEIAAILADCLTPLGIECILASDGKSALDRLSETAFDAVFCDVSMPGMDGLAFYSILKVNNPVLANHLVFISGDVLHRDWDRLKSLVDRPIIEKPFDPQQIREVALLLLQEEGGRP